MGKFPVLSPNSHKRIKVKEKGPCPRWTGPFLFVSDLLRRRSGRFAFRESKRPKILGDGGILCGAQPKSRIFKEQTNKAGDVDFPFQVSGDGNAKAQSTAHGCSRAELQPAEAFDKKSAAASTEGESRLAGRDFQAA